MLNIEQIEKAAAIAAQEYPVKSIKLFGSYANGTNSSDSDVDLLVEFTEPITLITLCSMKYRIEDLLNTPVDLIHAPLPKNSLIELDKVVTLYAA